MGDFNCQELSPEWRLLLACMGSASSDARPSIDDLLAAPIDWTAFILLMIQHGVTYRALTTLASRRPSNVPPDILAAASVRVEAEERRGRDCIDQLLTIVDALGERGICAVPFKGPALAELLYGEPGARVYRDLDFLVPRADAPATMTALADLGYARKVALSPRAARAKDAYAGQEILFSKKPGALPIEPHWALVPSTFPIAIDYEGLWQRLRRVTLRGRSVSGFAPEDLATALCIHGGKEEWGRLQWVCDLDALLRAEPGIDWHAVLERANRQGCRRMVLLGFAMTQRLLGTSLPPPLAAAITTEAVVRSLTERCARNLVGDKPAPSIYTLSSIRLQMRERLGDKLRHVVLTLMTPREKHLRMVDLPARLSFMYYAVKLGHDGVLLPLWLLFKWARGRWHRS